MIPLKLQLKNFLSYGSDIQTIDFAPYHLICLSGKNGHGKSALLDAMTWALWGQARKVSGTVKADQGLLHLGQTQMKVIFDFECNGQHYRIRREYAQTYGKPYAALEFGMLDEERDTFMPLSDKTIRTTQAKIEQTLHLDFESFINSAFLRQGQANEFSKKSSKDRKEILATILGLNQYEIVRKLANEKAKEAFLKKNNFITLQEKMQEELQKSESITANITSLQGKLNNIAQEESDVQKKKRALEKEQKKILNEQQTYQILSFQLQQFSKEEKEQQALLRQTVQEWKSIHKKQLNLPNSAYLETERKRLSNEIKEHQALLQKSLENKEQYLKQKEIAQQLEQKFHQEHATTLHDKKVYIERLFIEQQALTTNIKELEKKQQAYEIERQQIIQTIDTLTKQVATKNNKTKELTHIQQQFEKRKEFHQKYVTQGNMIKNELDNFTYKKQLVYDTNNPSCPLCEQNLSASRKRFLQNKFAKDEQFLKHRFNRLAQVINHLKKLLIEQHAHLEHHKKMHEERQTLQIKIDELRKTDAKLQHEQREINKLNSNYNKQLKTVNKQIEKEQKVVGNLQEQNKKEWDNNPAYKAIKEKLVALEQEKKQLIYRTEEHKAAAQQLNVIEQQLIDHATIHEQSSLQTQRKKEIHALCITLKKLKHQKKEISIKLEQFNNLHERESRINKQEAELVTTLKELNKQKELLLQEKGSLENQKIKQAQLEQEYKEQQKTINALTETIYDYQTIATATSKDGIQALLIEDAIPEIEQEANQLLAKLTDNQSQIFIESLRDLKKGGTKETLDIKISDSVGIRPYELFSGGEAFRIDFALRIAISKLLARRAGTSLQTLIIDEGFGSQDEEGLAHIMDMIYKIQDDFSKVIIVSHLTVMKDQFPVHFVAEKGPNGSTIKIIEHG